MTKKHFEALAAALKQAGQEYGDSATYHKGQWRRDVEMVALTCMSFNPNFDRARFLKACGVEEGK